MLDSLHIKNFRMLEDFEVKKLGRLNLIVGKNNSGKSTVLEALRVYAEKDTHSILRQIINEHNEDDFNDLLSRKNLEDQNRSITINDYLFDLKPLSKKDFKHSISYIPTQFLPTIELAEKWDIIFLSEYEEIVNEAMQIINQDYERMSFIHQGEKRVAKVKLRGSTYPVPLKSLGDGMLRVLQFALNLVPAQNGLLLIDEFENGLHYSVQEKIWTLLFEMAEKLDIQVFATTHSWDCIENFTKVALAHKETEAVLFRMGRSIRNSDKGRVIATVFDTEALQTITQSDMEVR